MADSNAVRARRSRRHRAGDHSICKADSFCRSDVDEPVILNSSAGVPKLPDVELGARGQELWRQMRTAMPGPLQVALLLEACRIADRLDTLDRQLHGDAWLRFRHHESDVEVTVYVDRVLAEAREQATAFRGIVVELQKSAAQAKPQTTGGGVLDALAAKRAARNNQTAG